MALTLSQIQAATNDYCDNRLTDIFFTENILLYKLLGSGNMDLHLVGPGDLADGGERIREILEYGKENSGTYAANTTMSTTKNDIINAARFTWAAYYGDAIIDLDDKIQNSGDAAMVDIIMAKLKNIEKTIRDTMGAAIYSAAGGDAKAFIGLGDLFNTTTSICSKGELEKTLEGGLMHGEALLGGA
jgi:ADP-dependent phosphofructokinase/glucokinase